MSRVTDQAKIGAERANDIKYKMTMAAGDMSVAESMLEDGADLVRTFPSYVAAEGVKLTTGSEDAVFKAVALGAELRGYAEEEFGKSETIAEEKVEAGQSDISQTIKDSSIRMNGEVDKIAKQVGNAVSGSDEKRSERLAEEGLMNQQYLANKHSADVFDSNVGLENQKLHDNLATAAEVAARILGDQSTGRTDNIANSLAAANTAETDQNERIERAITEYRASMEQYKSSQVRQLENQMSAHLASETAAETRQDEDMAKALTAAGLSDDQIKVVQGLTETDLGATSITAGQEAEGTVKVALTKMNEETENLEINAANIEAEMKEMIVAAGGEQEEAARTLAGQFDLFTNGFDSESSAMVSANQAQLNELKAGAMASLQNIKNAQLTQIANVENAQRQIEAGAAGDSTHMADQVAGYATNMYSQGAQLNGMENGARSDAQRMQGQINDVFQKLQRESAALISQNSEIEAAGMAELNAVGTGAQVATEHAKLDAYRKEEERAAAQEKGIADQANFGIQGLIALTDATLTSVAKNVVPGIRKVNDARKAIQDKFGAVKGAATTQQLAIRQKLTDMRTKQKDMKDRITSREKQLIKDMEGIGGTLGDAFEMTKYSSPEALQDVIALLGNAVISDSNIQTQVDTQLIPQSEHWRSGIGQIFELLGLTLNMDKITAAAENSMRKEQQLRDQVNAASGEIDASMMASNRLARQMMDEEKKKMKTQMDDIRSRSDLSEGEKAKLIRELREAFDKNSTLILEKAHLIITSQGDTKLNLEQQERLLDSLVARAKSAASAWENPPTRDQLETMHVMAKQYMKQVGDKIASSLVQTSDQSELQDIPENFRVSLIQMSDETDQQENLAHVALTIARHSPDAKTMSQAVNQMDVLEEKREKEEQGWEAKLASYM